MPGSHLARRGPVSKRVTVAAGGPPTYVSYTGTVFTGTGAKTTASIAVNVGDVLVVAIIGNEGALVAAPTGGGLTYTLRQNYGLASKTTNYIYTAVATSTTSFAVSATGPTSMTWGMGVHVFRNATVGASNKAAGTTGLPVVSLTTTKASSAIVLLSGDYNANARTAVGYLTNAGAFTESAYYNLGTTYTAYSGYHANAGAIGAYNVGVTNYTGAHNWNICAIEIQGP